MKVNSELNEQIFKQFKDLYTSIVLTNYLYDDLVAEINIDEKDKDQNRLENKDNVFCDTWKQTRNKIDDHRTSPDLFSVIASTQIDALATEKDILSNIVHINSISKKYSLAKIYYRAKDNYENFDPNSDFPYFGMSLVLALTFNTRIFKVEIAKSTKGCSKLAPYQINTDNLTITNRRKEIKFQSQEKFGDIIIFCERVIKLVNEKLKKAGLEELDRNIEIFEE